MKICSKCGHQNDDRNEFCSGCLNPITDNHVDVVEKKCNNENVGSSKSQSNFHQNSAGASSHQTSYANVNNNYAVKNITGQSIWDETNPLWYKICKFFLVADAIAAIVLGVILFLVYITNTEPVLAFIFLIAYPLTFIIVCAWGMLILNHIQNVSKIKKMMEFGYSVPKKDGSAIDINELPKL